MIRFAVPFVLLGLAAPILALVVFRSRLRHLVLSAFAVATLIVALAGPELRTERAEENVFFLMDRSASVAGATDEGEVEETLASMRAANPEKRFGTIAFASRAILCDPLSPNPPPADRIACSDDLGVGTNLAPAVTLGLAALPNAAAGQLVLVSDGRITDGLLEAVSAARTADTPISVLPVGHASKTDAALVSLNVPARVEVGRPFQISASIRSAAASIGVLTLYRDGEVVATSSVPLVQGMSRFQMRDVVPSPGSHTYRATVRREDDLLPQNDALSAFTQAGTGAPVLVVSSDAPAALLAALHGAGKTVAVRSAIPSLEELGDVRQIVLTGLPLSSLGARDLDTLHAFVSDLGGGLLVAEGEAELRGGRAGGIEDLLPVTYTLPQRAEEASLGVVYLLDRSASMLGSAEGVLKIDVVKEAAAACIGLLEPDAQVGILAFDRDFRWLAPIAPVGDGRAIYDSLRTLEASGGTDVYYPVLAALDALSQVRARVKHILVLSDGKTVDEPRDWSGLLARLAAEPDIHLSAIAVGPQPNRMLLDRLAEAGRGTVYAAVEVSSLPQVSMEATQRLSRSRFASEETPVSGLLASGDLADIPPLGGYVVTYSRPTAEVLLAAGSDPVFARWRVGLGRVGVLNTDLAGVWSAAWLAWSRAPLLLETIVGSVETETWLTLGLEPSVDVRESGIRIRVEAREPGGGFADFLDLSASILPDGGTFPLVQASAGLYQAERSALAEGAYALRIVDRTRDRVATLPFAVPYPSEVREAGVDLDALQAIARATGGHVLGDDLTLTRLADTKDVSYTPIHRQVLLVGLALFLLELARRKVPRRFGRAAVRDT